MKRTNLIISLVIAFLLLFAWMNRYQVIPLHQPAAYVINRFTGDVVLVNPNIIKKIEPPVDLLSSYNDIDSFLDNREDSPSSFDPSTARPAEEIEPVDLLENR